MKQIAIVALIGCAAALAVFAFMNQGSSTSLL